MPSAYNDFVKLHMLSLGNSIPAKERMVMIGKLWSSAKEVKPTVLDKTDKKDKVKAVKADKADKQVKAVKPKKVKGGSFVQESPSNSSAMNVLDALKSNNIERGGYQGYQGHYPDAVNQSTLQQLIKKH